MEPHQNTGMSDERIAEIMEAWHMYLLGDKRVFHIETAIPLLLKEVKRLKAENARAIDLIRTIGSNTLEEKTRNLCLEFLRSL